MKSAPTVVKAAMPVLFHEPYVEIGFRPIHQPWKSYMFSLFQWHNEVMNIWTHLIGLFMILIRGGLWWTEFNLVSDPYMWPLGVSLITMIALYSCSAGAHCFHTKSELAHYVCFMIDYAGIGLYGFGSTMLHFWYCSHEVFFGSYFHQVGIPAGALLGVITCYCCSLSKVKYKRPYPYERRLWQIGSVASIYLWLSIPVWMKIGLYAYEGKWEPSFGDHLTQSFWFILGGFFFGSDIPQRLFPGKFDFVGHSHQLFHICIMMTTCKQMDGVYFDLTKGIYNLRRTPAPTILGTWGALLFVAIASAAVVFNFYKAVKNNLISIESKDFCHCNGHEANERKPRPIHNNGTKVVFDTISHPENVDQKVIHRNGWKADALNGSL